MKTKYLSFGLPEFVGMGTWLLVFSISLYWVSRAGPVYQDHLSVLIAAFVIYLVCFLLLSSDNRFGRSIHNKAILLLIQLVASYLLIWFFPIDFLPILTIIWISLVSHLVSLKRSIIILLLVVSGWYLIETYHWQQAVIMKSLLYVSFHFFAIMMSHQTKIAEQATEKTNQLNAELIATQNLLNQASRLNERTRIARDLHDLVGHHMTALIINLQIISHLTEDDTKKKVDQCHALSKLLLSDIRVAVSSLRQNQTLDFKALFQTMIKQVPKLEIHDDIKIDFELEDIQLVTNLLSIMQEAITNCLKHSHATKLYLKMFKQNKTLFLEISDNGQVKPPLFTGNGLNGMKERVSLLKGNIDFTIEQQALKIKIQLPINRELAA
ncbi:MAG: histidine kinase [Enterobacterales bacterium]|nr:histidine kinase [Enterobacterales bacterium]